MADLFVIMESCERASKEDLEKIFTKVELCCHREPRVIISLSTPQWRKMGSFS